MAVRVKHIRPLTALASMLLSLAGCDMYKLEELRHTAPSGSPFQSELSRLYMDYATQAERGYDWGNSWHFADKGLMLAYGRDVEPEAPENWDIPESVRPDLERARSSLLSVLTPDVMRVSPSKAAEAQFYFDCWVKEQEQNWRDEHIAYCRDNLMLVLQELHAPSLRSLAARESETRKLKKPAKPAAPRPQEPAGDAGADSAREAGKEAGKEAPRDTAKETSPSKAEAAKVEPAPEIREPVVESTSYAVFFETDRAEVSEPGMNVITEVIRSLRESRDYVVILHSSRDHPGKAAERIQVVKKLLAAGGVKESAIRIGLGKTEIETGKAAQRRVEIFLNE